MYTDPSVRALASKHIFVKLDAEDGGKGQAFAQANRVSGFPTLIVYTADGKQLANQPGAFRQAVQISCAGSTPPQHAPRNAGSGRNGKPDSEK